MFPEEAVVSDRRAAVPLEPKVLAAESIAPADVPESELPDSQYPVKVLAAMRPPAVDEDLFRQWADAAAGISDWAAQERRAWHALPQGE